MAGIETGIELLEDIFFNSTFTGQSWIMYLTIIVGSLLIITRTWKDWGELALPVMVGWKYFGMPIPTIFLTLGAIIFIISTLSLKVVTASLGTLGERIVSARDLKKIGKTRKFDVLSKGISVKDEMAKLRLRKAYETEKDLRTPEQLIDIEIEKKKDEEKIISEIKRKLLKKKLKKSVGEKLDKEILEKEMIYTKRRKNE